MIRRWYALVAIIAASSFSGSDALAQSESSRRASHGHADEEIRLLPLTKAEGQPQRRAGESTELEAVPLVRRERSTQTAMALEDVSSSYQELRLLPSIEELRFGLPETICPPDERMPVIDTTQGPYSANCLLLLTLPDGSRARGTGWLTDATTVVTAGHCVHEGSGGSFFSRIEVIPGAYVARVDGFDVLRRPFGSKTVSAERLRASNSWQSDGTMAFDYGAILLDSPFAGDDGSPATLPIAVLNDTELQSSEVNLAGYPGDKPTGTQWEHGGPLHRVDPTRLSYRIDTIGGQSGSAVYRLNGGNVEVVGIHNYGGCPNRCTRITAAVMDDVEAWQSTEAAQAGSTNAGAPESTTAAPQSRERKARAENRRTKRRGEAGALRRSSGNQEGDDGSTR